MGPKRAIPSALSSLLAPPSCSACAAASDPGRPLCASCDRRLARGTGRTLRVPGLEAAWAARPYAGAARELVAAVKFRGLLPAIGVAADVVAAESPGGLLDGALVPVPADPLRRAWRGFDPADLLATELGRRTGRPVSRCLRREHAARQVGRSRSQRLAAPPRARAIEAPPAQAVLVDDVITTGATLAACARALRAAGAERVHAVAFAASGRALGAPRSRA